MHTEQVRSDIFFRCYNVMIDGNNFFGQPVKSNLRTYVSTWKTATGQEDHCTTGSLLDYSYFRDHYKMIAI